MNFGGNYFSSQIQTKYFSEVVEWKSFVFSMNWKNLVVIVSVIFCEFDDLILILIDLLKNILKNEKIFELFEKMNFENEMKLILKKNILTMKYLIRVI